MSEKSNERDVMAIPRDRGQRRLWRTLGFWSSLILFLATISYAGLGAYWLFLDTAIPVTEERTPEVESRLWQPGDAMRIMRHLCGRRAQGIDADAQRILAGREWIRPLGSYHLVIPPGCQPKVEILDIPRGIFPGTYRYEYALQVPINRLRSERLHLATIIFTVSAPAIPASIDAPIVSRLVAADAELRRRVEIVEHRIEANRTLLLQLVGRVK